MHNIIFINIYIYIYISYLIRTDKEKSGRTGTGRLLQFLKWAMRLSGPFEGLATVGIIGAHWGPHEMLWYPQGLLLKPMSRNNRLQGFKGGGVCRKDPKHVAYMTSRRSVEKLTLVRANLTSQPHTPFHLLPSPVHNTGFSFCFFPGSLAIFILLSNNIQFLLENFFFSNDVHY